MDDVRIAARKLLAYCRANDWAGYDPYDALNSRIFQVLPFLDARIPRIILTQALKRSPIDIHRLLLIPKTQNPKAVALFIMATLKLSRFQPSVEPGLVSELTDLLSTLRSRDDRYSCWGYSFPWQTRTIVVPREAPNLVCTTFAASALLDAYEQRRDSRCLTMALSAAEYIVNELYWDDGHSAVGFSYPQPLVRSRTHNANLLAAGFLCRVFKHTGNENFLGPALKVARYSVSKQQPDGSWEYGEEPWQRWIDNFHTGYNLCALQSIGQSLDTHEFETSVQRGFEFYRAHFFEEDGAAKYFHDRTYPVDIHSVAQSIITLVAFRDLDPGNLPLAESVMQWALRRMWDDRGFFYYQAHRFSTIRTSYMRWSQAWMLLAMSMLVSGFREACRPERVASHDLSKAC
jgi:N-acylglucosamine 2-epimerase (GlcNAc 2-epimerase)